MLPFISIEKIFLSFFQKNYNNKIKLFGLVCYDKFSILSQKFFVSKDFFGESFLDIFFVHFLKVKILFIFRKLAILYNKFKILLKENIYNIEIVNIVRKNLPYFSLEINNKIENQYIILNKIIYNITK
jgi:hypothetical protein